MSINNFGTFNPLTQQQPTMFAQPQTVQSFAQPQVESFEQPQSFAQPQLAQSFSAQPAFSSGGSNMFGGIVQLMTQMMTMMMSMMQTLMGSVMGGQQQQPVMQPQPQPITSQPVSGEPVTGEPVTGEPVSGQPITSQPVTGQPVTQPVTGYGNGANPPVAYQPTQPTGYPPKGYQPPVCQPQPPVCQPQPPVCQPQPPVCRPPQPPVCHPQPPVYTPPTYGGGSGSYCWGDPHFTDFDQKSGTNSFDFMGQAGQTFNILSDKNVEVNSTFQAWGTNGANIMSDAGIQVSNGQGQDDKIYFNAQNADKSLSTAAPTINGVAMQANQAVTLPDGGTATWDGSNDLKVNTSEYSFDFNRVDGGANGSYLKINANVATGANPFADGVAPHGILGQTADGDGKARTGDTGPTAQGGGAIEIIDPTTGKVEMSKAGNTQYQDYETSGLWGTTNNAFNRFGESVAQTLTDGSGKVTETIAADGTVLYNANDP